MKSNIFKSFYLNFILLLFSVINLSSAGFDDYKTFLNAFIKLDYDKSQAYKINDCMLRYPYCAFMLDEGQYYPLNKLGGIEYGGLYIGSGVFDFNISALEERLELKRNFRSEQINGEIEWVMFFSADSTHYNIISNGEKSVFPFKIIPEPLNALITSNISMNKNIVESSTAETILEGDFSQFCFHIIKLKNFDEPLIYQISPEKNEAVQIHRALKNTKGFYAKMLSRYFNANENNTPIINLNDKHQVKANKYIFKLNFDSNIKTDIEADIECEAVEYTGNWILTNLFPRAEIYEISLNNEVVDYHYDSYYSQLFIKLKKALDKGEKFKLNFKYSGKILYKLEGITQSRNTDNWYPKFGNNQKSMFEIYSSHTNKKNIFKTIGTEIENKYVDGKYITHWKTDEPVLFASFFIAPYIEQKLKTKDGKNISLMYYYEADKNVISQNVLTMLDFAKIFFGNLKTNDISMIFNANPVYNFTPGYLILDNSFVYYYNLDFAFEIVKLYFSERFMLRSDRDFWLLQGLGQYLGILYTQNVVKKSDLVESGMKESIDFQFLTPNTITSKIKKYPSTIILNREQETDLNPSNIQKYSNYIVANAASNNYYQFEYENSVSTTPLYRIKESFDKSGWIFHMLRYIMHGFKNSDDVAFITVIKEFFDKYQGKTISTEDFIKHLEELTEYDFSWFFDQWLKSYDLPIYKFAYKIEEKNGKFICKIKMKQEEVPASFKMIIPIALKLGDEIIDVNKILFTGGDIVTIELNPTDKRPDEIIFNYKNAVLCKHNEVGWDKL